MEKNTQTHQLFIQSLTSTSAAAAATMTASLLFLLHRSFRSNLFWLNIFVVIVCVRAKIAIFKLHFIANKQQNDISFEKQTDSTNSPPVRHLTSITNAN